MKAKSNILLLLIRYIIINFLWKLLTKLLSSHDMNLYYEFISIKDPCLPFVLILWLYIFPKKMLFNWHGEDSAKFGCWFQGQLISSLRPTKFGDYQYCGKYFMLKINTGEKRGNWKSEDFEFLIMFEISSQKWNRGYFKLNIDNRYSLTNI